jgi:hypothetical protein
MGHCPDGGWRLGINVGFWINYLSYLYSNRFDYRFLGFCIPDIYLLHGCHVTNTGKKIPFDDGQ